MSQIEALMLVALGFLLALMLVFAFGRSIWAASNLYAKRKREKDMPAAMLELQAECDRLRADNARMARKLEVGTEHMSTKVVAQMAEVSRHRDRLLAMSDQSAKANEDLARTAGENLDLSRQVGDLNRELDAQHKLINQLRQELAKLAGGRPAIDDLVMAPANENPSLAAQTPNPAPELHIVTTDESGGQLPGQPQLSPAMARAAEANDKAGKSGRFNFDRKPLSPSMERTINPLRRPGLKDVIEEARRSFSDDAKAAPVDDQPTTAADPVLGFAQRIREIQKKNDARLNKTLK